MEESHCVGKEIRRCSDAAQAKNLVREQRKDLTDRGKGCIVTP